MKSAISERETQIGQRLRDFRESKMIPRTSFAVSLYIGPERLASYEAGRVPLRFGLFAYIHLRHLIDPTWLATGKGNPMRASALSTALLSSFPARSLFSEVYDKYLATVCSDRAVVVHEGIDRLNRVMEETIQEVRSGVPALRSSIAAIESRLLAAQKIIASARKYSLSPSLSKKGVAQLEAYFNVAYPEIEKSQLTDTSLKSRTVDVNIQTLDELRTILRARTAEKGGMARLAESLGVQQARVSEWLSGKKEPGGKTTLRLLQWVEQQERQPNAPDSVTSTAKGKTQVRKSPNEKQTQVRKKG